MDKFQMMEAAGLGPTTKQRAKAIMAARRRTEDPLKNWTRPPREECPICLAPMPFDELTEAEYWDCCGKVSCGGCMLNQYFVGENKRELDKALNVCPFCREKREKGDARRTFERNMRLAHAGCSRVAMYNVAGYYFRGDEAKGVRKDLSEALKWYHRALEAGSAEAGLALAGHHTLCADLARANHYYRKASELGLPLAFGMLGQNLFMAGDVEDALLNYRKAAICGASEESVFNGLRHGFTNGYITKDEYAYALRENQSARDEVKSKWRDVYKKSLAKEKGEVLDSKMKSEGYTHRQQCDKGGGIRDHPLYRQASAGTKGVT